jgi:hypothetical protein
MFAEPHSTIVDAWLELWECLAGHPQPVRDLEVLRAATESSSDPGDFPVGRRDQLLLELREALFGRTLACTAECPNCGERCEWDCAVEALRFDEVARLEPFEWSFGPWKGRLRAINAADLAAVSVNSGNAVHALLERCLSELHRGDDKANVEDLTVDAVANLSSTLAAADPQAAAIDVTCPACAHAWDADFDAGAFFWTELDAWAQKLLFEVHELATRYGWSEREVLALSASRRSRYLAMANA